MRRILAVAACALFLLHAEGNAPAQDREKAGTPPPGATPAEGFRLLDPGALAPEFSIPDADGNLFRFADERGKRPVLLFFWSIFCEPCRLEMPLLQKMHAQHRDAGLDVIAISLDGAPMAGSVRGFARQEGYAFRVLIDALDAREAFKAADPYGVAVMPTLYLVDRAGRILLARAGRMKEEELEKAVQALLRK